SRYVIGCLRVSEGETLMKSEKFEQAAGRFRKALEM
ncbi:unnamed protein product, partial [Allacma fusca]